MDAEALSPGGVDLVGRYSNHFDQGERLRSLIEMVPNGVSQVNVRTKRQVHRRLRPHEIDELVVGYRAGATVYELANLFRINRTTVSLVLERQNVPRRNRPFSPTQIQQAQVLYAAGQSLAKAGKQLGCDASTVRLALLRVGVRMRDTHGRDR